MVFYGFLWFFHGFFKELDFKELEIHRYSLMDIHHWISMDIQFFEIQFFEKTRKHYDEQKKTKKNNEKPWNTMNK